MKKEICALFSILLAATLLAEDSRPQGANITPDTAHPDYVAPFVPFHWAQEIPFNDFMPIYDSGEYFGDRGRTASGCVATAMAQVLPITNCQRALMMLELACMI